MDLTKYHFFYFTFLWVFGPTIKSRIKESFTLVTSTGTFREKHSQPLFVTELTLSGIPVCVQTDGVQTDSIWYIEGGPYSRFSRVLKHTHLSPKQILNAFLNLDFSHSIPSIFVQ